MPCSARASPRPRLQGARAARTRSALPARDRRGSPKRHLSETAVARGRASHRARPRPTWSPFLETRRESSRPGASSTATCSPRRAVVPRSASPRNPRREGKGGGRHSACAFRVLFYLFFTLRSTASSDRSLTSSLPSSLQVACETATKTGMVMVFGEITTAKVDYEAVVRKVQRRRLHLRGCRPRRQQLPRPRRAPRPVPRVDQASTVWAPRRSGRLAPVTRASCSATPP